MKLTDVIQGDGGAKVNVAPGLQPAAIPLSEILRTVTRKLHSRAERSGIIRELFQRRVDHLGYALLIRNLLPAYRAMEIALPGSHLPGPHLSGVPWPALFRAPAIVHDLNEMNGPQWEAALPLLPAGMRYARRVALSAEHGIGQLLAHAYVRYFGDLSGGQILKRLLGQPPGLGSACLTFLEFPDIVDPAAIKLRFRAALDRAASTEAERDGVLREAAIAFRLNIAVSEAVQLALPLCTASAGRAA